MMRPGAWAAVAAAVLGTCGAAEAGLITTFKYTGAIEQFTADTTGTYHIELAGAAGGEVGALQGGRGAIVGGDIELTAGQILAIVVGGGGGGGGGYGGGGGGGGSFVYLDGMTG